MSNYKLVKHFFEVAETKNLERALELFTENAKFIDPHYPRTHMQGKKEILEGLTWGFSGLKKLGFTIEKYFETKEGNSIAVEVATAHELSNGKVLNFPQVFIIDIQDKKISRCQAYEPYGPHGMLKVILGGTRLIMKVRKFFLFCFLGTSVH